MWLLRIGVLFQQSEARAEAFVIAGIDPGWNLTHLQSDSLGEEVIAKVLLDTGQHGIAVPMFEISDTPKGSIYQLCWNLTFLDGPMQSGSCRERSLRIIANEQQIRAGAEPKNGIFLGSVPV